MGKVAYGNEVLHHVEKGYVIYLSEMFSSLSKLFVGVKFLLLVVYLGDLEIWENK